MSKTLDYYNKNAELFVGDTANVSFYEVQDRFLSLIPSGGAILDFGCGSGRDTKYFLSKGFSVDATDGSSKICEIASKETGIKVRQMMFDELDEDCKYDGIWACASILHLPKKELIDVLKKMIRAVKPDGIIYTSFKYGEFEGYRNERYFTYFTEESFETFLKEINGIKLSEQWISSDVRPGRGEEKWLNVIMKKTTL